MEKMVIKEAVIHGTTGGFAAMASAFLQESLSHMVPWLIASAAVIVCDLAFGLRKSMMIGETIRISKAIRRTMGKMVTYFSFVCMVCMVNVASGENYGIDKWACLLVCSIEFMSIISNILKPKGYSLNVRSLVALLLGKVFGTDRNVSDVLRKDEDSNGS